MNVGKFAEAETADTRRICVTVNGDGPTASGRLERLSDLLVQLEVRRGAPVLRLYIIHTPTQMINTSVGAEADRGLQVVSSRETLV